MKSLMLCVLISASLLADAPVVVQPQPAQPVPVVQVHKKRCPWRTMLISSATSALTTVAMFATVIKFYND